MPRRVQDEQSAGTYILLVRLDGDHRITIGRLGSRCLGPGHYLYCGSALNGLEGRLARHFRADKRVRWHVDYLLPCATVLRAWVIRSRVRLECACQAALCQIGGVPIRGFGCSDCRCRAHLVYFSKPPSRKAFEAALRGLAPGSVVEEWRREAGLT